MVKANFKIEDIAKEVAVFLSPHIRVERVVLYGSYGYGSPRKDSDLDMAVISDDFRRMPVLKKIDLFSSAAVAIDARLELKGFTKSEFLRPGRGSLLELIKKKGRVIYGNGKG